jgi:NhaA family Na+:H+ antiporter
VIERKTTLINGYRDLAHSISGEFSKSLKEALENLNHEVIFRYKYCPELDKNPLAINAAKAVVAAEKQGKSEEMYQRLVNGNIDFSEPSVYEVAEDLGLDIALFGKHYISDETLSRIQLDIRDAEASGLKVFPGLTINGQPYNGAWDNYSLINTIKNQGSSQIKLAIEGFIQWGASAAVVLIIATATALLMVNVGFQEVYDYWKHSRLGLMLGSSEFILPLEVWINDFLMAIFFLMIGLEIKREINSGELSDMRRAAMPIIGAVGGMLIPALIYFGINFGEETSIGWGIPMATDIAFTLGLMALLGKKVPLSLKIFISALAVADDLGAIVVIALFYGHGFHFAPFIGAIIVICLMFVLNKQRVDNIVIYLLLGVVLWLFVFESGIHATLAGVITAFFIPSKSTANLSLIAQQANIIFDREVNSNTVKPNHNGGSGALKVLKNAMKRLTEPSLDLQHSLEKASNYLILPLFAFFNTGIILSGIELDLIQPGNLGIILGLSIGKPLGIVGACFLAYKLNLAKLSPEINWIQLVGASFMAGIGFTMSIVVASSAFSGDLLTSAKISILIASVASALIGLGILRIGYKPYSEEKI